MLCDDLWVWDWVGMGRAVQKSQDICTHKADSLSCIAETTQHYKTTMPLFKKKKERKKEGTPGTR